MTEALLAFVSIVCGWKIIQVWLLKRRLARQEKEKATIRMTVELVSRDLARLRDVMRTWTPADLNAPKATSTDIEWPEEIS